MQIKDFSENATGRLVPTVNGHMAFVPNPLPPKVDVGCLIAEMSDAMMSLGHLKGAVGPLANPSLVIRPMQYREAVSSSGMEGTYTTFTDLLMFDAGGNLEAGSDTREVHNYLRALRKSDDLLERLPVCVRLILDLHTTLMSGIRVKARGATIKPGALKLYQNFIGGSLERPRFVPPPPKEAESCLYELEGYLNKDVAKGMELINAAYMHYQFEAIHPFPDGNGRVGRILIPVYLKYVELIDGPYLYMSEFFERNKDQYIDLMYSVSSEGAWIEWLKFFLIGAKESCDIAIKTSKELIACSDHFKSEINQGKGRSAVLSQIMDQFLISPALTVPDVAVAIGQSDQTVRNNMEKLESMGLVRAISTHRPKIFISPHVLSVVSGRRE